MNASTPRFGNSEALNLSSIATLLVDADQYAVEILGQILRGFGVSYLTVADSGAAAKEHLERSKFDLVLTETVLPDMLGADLVRWLRRHESDTICYVPVVMLTGHTEIKNIETVRDSGANSVVKKPVSSSTLFDHISWSARTSRAFVSSETFVGPDRRFRHLGPPNGVGRRSTDLSAEIGEATDPNMSQNEIDSFMKPMKMVID